MDKQDDFKFTQIVEMPRESGLNSDQAVKLEKRIWKC